MRKITIFVLAGILFLTGCISGDNQQETQPIQPQSSTISQTKTTTITTTSLTQTDSGSTKIQSTTITASEITSTTTTVNKPVIVEIDMEAKRYDFIPSTVRAKQGDTVILHVTSTDVAHGITIREYGINVDLPVGKKETIEFTADKKGTFRITCSVFCGSGHRSMTGTLIVE